MGTFLPRKSKSFKVSIGSFEKRPNKKSKQEYRVSGSRNRQPESTWSERNAAMPLIERTER